MNIITIPILALLAVANAQLGGQNVGDRTVGNQLKQCTCDDQYRGFREWKDFAFQCFDQCRVQKVSQLRQLVDTPVKLYTCIDKKINMLHNLFDCVNMRLLQQDSCVSDKTDQDKVLQFQDFRQVFVRNMDPLVDEIYNTLLRIDQNAMQRYGHIILDDCSRNCLTNKIKQSQMWDQINCLPKVDELIVKKHIQQCYHDVHYKETLYKICTCAVGVGVTDLHPFCQKIRRVRFPHWAEERIFGLNRDRGLGVFGDDGISGVSEDEGISGDMSQDRQERVQKLVVKLDIQQEQPEYHRRKFDQDYLEGLGGYKQDVYDTDTEMYKNGGIKYRGGLGRTSEIDTLGTTRIGQKYDTLGKGYKSGMVSTGGLNKGDIGTGGLKSDTDLKSDINAGGGFLL